MLLFVNNQIEPLMQTIFNQINMGGRVSPEVLSLHLATPSRSAVRDKALHLKQQGELEHVERIARLKPNNAVRDLTAPWRLQEEFVNTHKLVLNLETVNPEFRHKYPDPNLTLPAGGIEKGEHSLHAAHRELFEETRIKVDPSLVGGYIGLFKNGMHMYCVVITPDTPIMLSPTDNTLYIGSISHINYFYDQILGRHPTSSPPPLPHHHYLKQPWPNTQTCANFNTRPNTYGLKRHGEQHSTEPSCPRTFKRNWMRESTHSKVVPGPVS